jgi:hypothetical protein
MMMILKTSILSFAIPAKAGIHGGKHWRKGVWTPAFAGVTGIRVDASLRAIVRWASL